MYEFIPVLAGVCDRDHLLLSVSVVLSSEPTPRSSTIGVLLVRVSWAQPSFSAKPWWPVGPLGSSLLQLIGPFVFLSAISITVLGTVELEVPPYSF